MMKKLPCISKNGFVYDVYDLGDGRVLKKEKPKLKQWWQHAYMAGNLPTHVERNNALSRRLVGAIGDLSFLGNPCFESKRSYTQDKLAILEHYFSDHSLDESKRAIDSFIECIFESWRNGFSDVIFNFTHNNGAYPDGRVALIDFNEVVIHKNIVAEKIRIKRWLFSFSYNKKLQEGPLKAYYAEAMAKAIALENLDKYWKDNEKLLGKTE